MGTDELLKSKHPVCINSSCIVIPKHSLGSEYNFPESYRFQYKLHIALTSPAVPHNFLKLPCFPFHFQCLIQSQPSISHMETSLSRTRNWSKKRPMETVHTYKMEIQGFPRSFLLSGLQICPDQIAPHCIINWKSQSTQMLEIEVNLLKTGCNTWKRSMNHMNSQKSHSGEDIFPCFPISTERQLKE